MTQRSQVQFDLTGATAIVTGGSQGIGLEITRLLAASGARVCILDLAHPDHAELPSDVMLEVGDVSDPETAKSAVDHVTAELGSPNVLVNNAGILRDGVIWKLGDQQWSEILAVHLTGSFNLSRAVIPGMRSNGFGRIINTTSYSGLHGNVGQTNYSAAKAGVIGLTKATAKEVGRFGITVNAVSPNADTSMVQSIPEDRRRELEAQIPLGRFGSPAEMAPMVAFLASDVGGYITGAVIPVDGGLSM